MHDEGSYCSPWSVQIICILIILEGSLLELSLYFYFCLIFSLFNNSLLKFFLFTCFVWDVR